MKNALITILLLFVALTSFGQIDCRHTDSYFTGICARYHINGNISHRIWYRHGEPTGRMESFRSDGNLITKSDEIHKYELTFRFYSYYPNSDLKAYVVMFQGTGRVVEYYENGNMKSDGYYMDSTAYGTWTTFDTSGNVALEVRAENLNPVKCYNYSGVISDAEDRFDQINEIYGKGDCKNQNDTVPTAPPYILNHPWNENFCGMCYVGDDASSLQLDVINGDTLIGIMQEWQTTNGREFEVITHIECPSWRANEKQPFNAWVSVGGIVKQHYKGLFDLELDNYVILDSKKQFEKRECR